MSLDVSDQNDGTGKTESLRALARCRERIDAIDQRLVELLNERTSIVEEIGSVKRDAKLAIYEPRRESEVFDNITSHNHGPLTADGVKRIFERIIDEMRRVQKDRMAAESDRTKEAAKD
jgi:chorismate mutase